MPPDVVLLGAGASVEAQVPASKDMTAEVVRMLSRRRVSPDLRLLRFALGGVLFNLGARGEDPLAGVDVEHLFAVIDLLGRRSENDLVPFIGTWHESLRTLESTIVKEELTKEDQERSRRLMMELQTGGSSLFAEGQPYDRRRTEGEEFSHLADRMLEVLHEIVVIPDDGRAAYLAPLVRSNVSAVATLNYDNTIEMACQADQRPVHTGAAEWSRTGKISPPEDDADLYLLKLHGSVNWRLQSPVRSAERPLEQTELHEGAWDLYVNYARDPRGHIVHPGRRSRPGLVFGSGSKLRSDGPFLALLRAFSEALSEATYLGVVGYSFRDEHINTEIARWINADATRQIAIVDPAFEQSDVPFATELRDKLGDRLVTMGVTAGEGVASLFVAS